MVFLWFSSNYKPLSMMHRPPLQLGSWVHHVFCQGLAMPHCHCEASCTKFPCFKAEDALNISKNLFAPGRNLNSRKWSHVKNEPIFLFQLMLLFRDFGKPCFNDTVAPHRCTPLPTVPVQCPDASKDSSEGNSTPQYLRRPLSRIQV